MNYLKSFLATLTTEEERRAMSLELPGRQRQTLRAVLNVVDRDRVDRDDLLRTLAMSSTHFDKTCSQVLRRLMTELYSDETSLLRDLCDRRLSSLLLHEIRKREKELRRLGDREKLKDFYWLAFRLLDSLAERPYQEGATMDLFESYAALDPGAETDAIRDAVVFNHELFVRMKMGRYEQVWEYAKGEAPKMERIIESRGDAAQWFAHRALARHYSLLEVDMERRIGHLEAGIAIVRRNRHTFEMRDEVLLLAAIAESEYYRDNLHVALDKYREIFAEHAEILRRDYYHVLKVAQLGLILGHYEYAERMVDRWFAEVRVPGSNPALLKGLIYLAWGRMDDAHRMICEGIVANRDNVVYEAHFRVMETLYFAFKGDYDFVDSLVEKHLRYLRAHGMGIRQSNFGKLLTLIRAMIDERRTGTPLAKRHRDQYNHMQFGARRQYGVLFEKLREALG